jgi:hypothetical protein
MAFGVEVFHAGFQLPWLSSSSGSASRLLSGDLPFSGSERMRSCRDGLGGGPGDVSLA